MKITLSPTRRDQRLTLERQGDQLIVNGEVFDFGQLAEGATLPARAIKSPWFANGTVIARTNGDLALTIVLPHGEKAPQATLFPDPITVTKNGPIDLPAYSMEEN
ncbi:hypothetical protein [Thalassococcus sp. S3]|uniref:hypothetical protein n=1 Tax=Thalassococcus sp. S3 TaxID=2017482 RepID=UPI0010240B29|nr:hypothetical protein [Thalassococcus sp. S3]QBF31486.1 hypothetical protein CFI11_09685 [Thalassococcus sp. S3]